MSAAITAREAIWTIGQIDLDQLRRHHLEVMSAAAELAGNAGVPWRWGAEDPTVVLVRALSHLAAQAPEATSVRAADLCRRLAGPSPRASAGGLSRRAGRR